ncbi:MAG: hypothetical protein QOH07_2742 [Mycobacterium sp.]|nr:hypothetical protein [Mycobacterium sp.]
MTPGQPTPHRPRRRLATFEPSCVDYSPSATIPSGSVVENLKSVLFRHNRAAARSTRPRQPDGCQAITSVSPHANAEEDIHDSRLETNNT